MKIEELSFNELLTKLKEIANKLEDSGLPLEDGIKLIEEGTKIHKLCKEKLQEAQLKVTDLFEEK